VELFVITFLILHNTKTWISLKRWSYNATVLEKLRIQDVFCLHQRPVFSNSFCLKSVFKKLCFRDRLTVDDVWTGSGSSAKIATVYRPSIFQFEGFDHFDLLKRRLKIVRVFYPERYISPAFVWRKKGWRGDQCSSGEFIALWLNASKYSLVDNLFHLRHGEMIRSVKLYIFRELLLPVKL